MKISSEDPECPNVKFRMAHLDVAVDLTPRKRRTSTWKIDGIGPSLTYLSAAFPLSLTVDVIIAMFEKFLIHSHPSHDPSCFAVLKLRDVSTLQTRHRCLSPGIEACRLSMQSESSFSRTTQSQKKECGKKPRQQHLKTKILL